MRRIAPVGGGWLVATDAGALTADTVVVATGDLTHPRIPALAGDLPPRVAAAAHQRLPQPGPATGGSGAGRGRRAVGAADRGRAGRERAPGAHGRRAAPLPSAPLPRPRHLLVDGPAGHAAPDGRLAGRRRPPLTQRGARRGHARPGRAPARGRGSRGARPPARGRRPDGRFADDLPATLATAEDNARRFRASVDAHVAATGARRSRRAGSRAGAGPVDRRRAARAGPRRRRRGDLGDRVPPRPRLHRRGRGRRRRAGARPRRHRRSPGCTSWGCAGSTAAARASSTGWAATPTTSPTTSPGTGSASSPLRCDQRTAPRTGHLPDRRWPVSSCPVRPRVESYRSPRRRRRNAPRRPRAAWRRSRCAAGPRCR